MSEKFVITEFRNQNNFMFRNIMMGLAHVSDEDRKKYFEPLTSKDTPEERIIELTLTANGVEIPIKPFFNYLQDKFEIMVNEEVAKILSQKINDVSNNIEEATKEIIAAMRAAIEKRGIELPKDKWGEYE